MDEQHSLNWFRARLGRYNASEVSALMGAARSKTEEFSAAAKTYITKVAAQRALSLNVVGDDEEFAALMDLNNPGSRIMAYGTEHEDCARAWYESETLQTVTETGSHTHADVPSLAASPDGFVEDEGLLEIKCPATIESAFKLQGATSPAELKEIKPEYYWQMVAQMAVTGRSWCDFVVWAPFMAKGATIMRFDRDKAAEDALIDKVAKADALANDMAGVSFKGYELR